MAEPLTPEDLLSLVEHDVRFVAVVWNNDASVDGRPQIVFGGCSDYEAAMLFRVAAKRMERYCRGLVDLPEEYEDDDDDEEDA